MRDKPRSDRPAAHRRRARREALAGAIAGLVAVGAIAGVIIARDLAQSHGKEPGATAMRSGKASTTPPGSPPSPTTDTTATPRATTPSGNQTRTAGGGIPPSPTNSLHGCAPHPHACGYPDGTNAGVPAGTQLQTVPQQVASGAGWTWNPGGWIEVTKPGTIISGLSVDGAISVNAPNVIIKDSYINCNSSCDFGIIIRDTSTGAEANADNTIVEDSTITDTSDTAAAGIEAENVSDTQVLRDNISGEGAGVLFAGGGGLIKDTYIHDLAQCCGYHNEDFQSTADGNVTLEHNTLFNQVDQTADIMITQDFGPQSNVTVEDNLLAGGGYSIYGGDTGAQQAGPATNIKIINNRLSTMYFPTCGFYGWLADFNTPPGADNESAGNYWDETGSPAT